MSITYKNVDLLGGDKVCMALLSREKKTSTFAKKIGKCPKLEQGETLFLAAQPKLKNTHVVLMMLKNKDHSVEDMRLLGGTFYKEAQKSKAKKLALSFLNLKEVFKENTVELIQGFVEGALLSDYSMQDGKSKPKKKASTSFEIYTKGAGAHELKDLKDRLKESAKLVEAVHFTRRLGDLPGNMMTPAILANEASSLKSSGLKVTVWDKKRIKKENMGCLLGVNSGSAEEPRFIIMEHKPKNAAKGVAPIALVGKGLTFDAGGISIKPSAGMDEMRYDMCGGAAVIGAMKLISEMNLPVHVVGLVPSTENLLGAAACKPGDILTAMNGKTVEVLNTDAEGRLILADALCYASTLKPKCVLNTATLTGAMVVALGNIHTGFFTKNDELADQVNQAANDSGESLWRMPLVDHHQDDMKGRFADLSNMSSTRGAGSATAAAFLENFCDEGIPFAHLDIAGTAWNSGSRKSYNDPKGATGVLVRTFYQFVKNQAS
jgi:leucyl aminopeptidase